MANVEKILYTAGNPHVYEPVPAESAYTELDREHSRRLAELARLRGELFDTRNALRRSEISAIVGWGCFGIVLVANAVMIGILLLR